MHLNIFVTLYRYHTIQTLLTTTSINAYPNPNIGRSPKAFRHGEYDAHALLNGFIHHWTESSIIQQDNRSMYPRTQNSHPIAHWNSSSTPINHSSIHPKGPSHPLKPTCQDLPICIKRMASYVLPACPILDGFICLILLSHACRRKCTFALRDRSLYPRFNPRSAKRHRRRSALFHIRWISTTNDCSHRLVNEAT